MVSNQYNTTPSAYCSRMRNETAWGGGPEIVCISNVLKRPIHVFELYTRPFSPETFELKICAEFGSPLYDNPLLQPFRILCADGR